MTTNITDFRIQIDRISEDLPARAFKEFRDRVALLALRGVVTKTPVDTGRARGNWQTSAGEETADEVEFSGRDPVGEGEAVIRGTEPFADVFIANHVPYIIPLERGHSKQAPSGMVAVTLAEIGGSL